MSSTPPTPTSVNEPKLVEKQVTTKPKVVIHREMTIAEVVDISPVTIEVFLEYGLHCVGCGAMNWETVEQGAYGHGFTDEEINNLIEDLNFALEEEKKRQ